MTKTLYEIIGVSQQATPAEIEARCIALGERYNPLHNPGDLEARPKFAEIENAYAVLSDKRRRAQYDASLNAINGGSNSRLMWAGAVSFLALGVMAFGGYSYWNKAEEQRIAGERARTAALQSQAMERERVRQAESSRKKALEQLPASRPPSMDMSVQSKGTIRSEESAKLQVNVDAERQKKIKATTELYVAKAILADVAALDGLKMNVITELRRIANRSARWGAAGTYGLGAGMAQRIETIHVRGCALNVRAQLVNAARRIDEIAQLWMNFDERRYGDIGNISTEDHERAIEVTINECKRAAYADIQFFSGIVSGSTR